MTPRVQLIGKDQVDLVWEIAEPVLALSQRRIARDVGTEDIYAAILAGHAQLWVIVSEDTLKAVLVTEIIQHPRSRILKIMHVAGIDMSMWIDEALGTMKRFAVDMDCDRVSADARLGWLKHAPKHGFKETHRVYEMEL
jgi:hypothetical protein|tara:strand:+ start:3013 stop:3429 length:417 start_codon:yes stop_codon:yes gene_type:complete